jgi:hypothetical protein
MPEYITHCPIIVTKVKEHSLIKAKLLELISDENSYAIQETFVNNTDKISNTDWNFSEDTSRQYIKFIQPILIECATEAFKPFNPEGLVFGNFWFQQYNANDTHGWHVHKNCHWTNVYYIELPDTSLKTQVQTITRNTIIDFEASEGDLVSFPSFLYHRSPVNVSAQRKTIISFNINFL